MRSDEREQNEDYPEEFEDISIVKNLLELQSRLRTKTDSIEGQSE